MSSSDKREVSVTGKTAQLPASVTQRLARADTLLDHILDEEFHRAEIARIAARLLELQRDRSYLPPDLCTLSNHLITLQQQCLTVWQARLNNLIEDPLDYEKKRRKELLDIRMELQSPPSLLLPYPVDPLSTKDTSPSTATLRRRTALGAD